MEKDFGALNYMCRKAKSLVSEKGILSTINPKEGRPLPDECLKTIRAFYESDEISHAMPGKRTVFQCTAMV